MLKVVSSSIAIGEGATDGTCGLIPFVGAAVCTQITRVMRLAWE
jgi:hypothetical protein